MASYNKYYVFLAVMILVSIFSMFIYRNNIFMEQIVIGGMVIGYVVWGVVYHQAKKDLTLNTVLEYVLLSSLAGFIVLALL